MTAALGLIGTDLGDLAYMILAHPYSLDAIG
jgi:hypothetical protein